MVLERYLTDILASQFGHFVEGLDKNQVRLSALWKGQVSLQNVRLRRQALDHFPLASNSDVKTPVEIAHGHVGTLQLNIPWQVVLQLWKGSDRHHLSKTRGTPSAASTKKLRRNRNAMVKQGGSVSLVLKDVHILIVPRRKQETFKEEERSSEKDTEINTNNETSTYDSTKVKDGANSSDIEIEQEIQAALEAELVRLATNISNNNPASSATHPPLASPQGDGTKTTRRGRAWHFWLQERVAHILENLTVTVQNIHVRYEDPGSSLGFVWDQDSGVTASGDHSGNGKQHRPSFCVGLTLKQFTIHSIQHPTTTKTSSTSESKEGGDEKGSANSPQVSKNAAPMKPTAAEASGFMTRYKRAAAVDLAVYWNSGTPIMSQVKENANYGESFYEHAFLAFQNGGQSDAKEGSSLSESARTALFGLFPPSSSKDGSNDMNTYVLHPFSPSVTFEVVHSRNRRPPTGSTMSTQVPPSTVEARLPPCHFTVSRDLVEDLGYLRKSFAVWVQARKYEHLRTVVKKRPTVSVHEDPRAWWKYAFESVLAVLRCSSDEQENHGKQRDETIASNPRPSETKSTEKLQYRLPPHSRQGWHALASAILTRRKYMGLYREFFGTHGRDRSAHEQLQQMERYELTTEEVVAFRIHAARQTQSLPIQHSMSDGKLVHTEGDDNTETSTESVALTGSVTTEGSLEKEMEESAVLSAEHRFRMFVEMKQTLFVADGGKFSIEDEDDDSSTTTATTNFHEQPFGLDNPKNRLSWTTHISCSEVSLQVNDKRIKRRHRDVPAPVVRLLFAFMQEQRLFLDGSWELALSVGSLHVEDLTSTAINNPISKMLGPKHRHSFPQHQEDDSFVLEDVPHICSGSLRIRRSQHGFRTHEFGSTTWTDVRVLPLEICYFTAPVEALVRILNTANLDFAYDYQRLGVQIYEWRERQRKRLLAALSHKQKSIFVQINVGAPTILLPDEDSLLIVDLGHLTFSNDDMNRPAATGFQYDDHWRLELASIQVQCASVKTYKSISSLAEVSSYDEAQRTASGSVDTMQQLIEPFSLIFAVSTKFHDNGTTRTDSVLVRASLPRLAFNLTSSAIRLVQRLRQQWDERQIEIRSSLLLPSRVLGGLAGKSPIANSNRSYRPSTRKIEFNFNAPLLRFKCENDVDGRDCNSSNTNSTQLLDLSFRGIEGSWTSSLLPSGAVHIASEAKLRGVDCVDLYQGAGEEFSLLISSIPPESIFNSENRSSDRYMNSTDLVSVNFESSIGNTNLQSGKTTSRLKIASHELFVEWNAETIAAVQKAFKVPNELILSKDDTDSQSEEFFDAEEDDFHDAGSVLTVSSDDEFPLEDIPSLQYPLERYQMMVLENGGLLKRDSSPPNPAALLSSFSSSPTTASPGIPPSNPKSFEIAFDLSKLRVNFNKESRHRRVVSAEMDRTSVHYSSREEGGYMASVTLGNFVLSDADSVDNKTLYREIVGLKTDVPLDRGKQASLLQMKIVKNPRLRRFVSEQVEREDSGTADEESVTIDTSNAIVQGCDIYFKAEFSPMRFVYLQQLWFEVIDFFFEGIVGYEVWGNKRPGPVPESQLKFAPTNANDFAFTRFDISLDSPVILVPVSYCCTDFLRIETDIIKVGNRYDYSPLRTESSQDQSKSMLKQQWFNNCTVKIGNVTLSSWSGRRLNSSDDEVNARIEMNWPAGPTAFLNKPKWKVKCSFDKTEVSLLREDYALVQHIVASNFGEGSRHLDEWDALQNLPPLVLERYKEDIMVHFGYDKKDVTPTTFCVALTLPYLSVSLLQVDRSETALIRCFDLSWDYWKHSDLISRQSICCEVNLSRREDDGYVWLLSGQAPAEKDEKAEALRPSLAYKSIFRPSGDIERSLDIGQALIHVGYPSWALVSEFFRALPPPSFISPENVIQVGDRWYKIAGSSAVPREPKRFRSLTWITAKKSRSDAPSRQQNSGTIRSTVLRFGLTFPQVSFIAGHKTLVLAMDTADYYYSQHSGNIETSFKTTKIKLTCSGSKSFVDPDEPVCLEIIGISGSVQDYKAGTKHSCHTHTTIVDVGAIKSALTHSVIMEVYEVLLQLKRDVRSLKKNGRGTQKESTGDDRDKSFHAPEVLLRVSCESMDVELYDDADNSLSREQKFLLLSLGPMGLFRKQTRSLLSPPSPNGAFEESAELSIQNIRFIDCIQPVDSPFRPMLVATPMHDAKPQRSFPPRTLGDHSRSLTYAIHVARLVDLERCRYLIDIHQVDLQYNPSIAFKLHKMAIRLTQDFVAANQAFPPGKERSLTHEKAIFGVDEKEVEVSAKLRHFSVRLNVEDDRRCLVHTLVQNTRIDCHQSKSFLEVKALVDDIKIIDSVSISGAVGNDNSILMVASDVSGPLLEIKLFSFPQASGRPNHTIPEWASSLAHDNEVDDILDMALSNVDFVFLAKRTYELCSYLGHSLPLNKTMSTKTSRTTASDKKTRRRCFNFKTQKVTCYIPSDRVAENGLMISGDFLVRSRISPDTAMELEGSLTNLLCKMYCSNIFGNDTHENRIVEGIEVLFHLEKRPDGRLHAKCGVSDVQARLCYTDYVHLMQVAQGNIAQRDVVHDCKTESRDPEQSDEDSTDTSNKEDDSSSTQFELTLALADVALVLRRDDKNSGSDVDYDMILFRGENFDFIFTSSNEGQTAVFSVKRIFAFDLGEQGRVLRSDHSFSNQELGPMPIAVMVEGYSSPEQNSSSLEDDEDTQIMARLDRPKGNSTETRISLVISRLSVTALFRPLEELAAFIGQSWTVNENQGMNIGVATVRTPEHSPRRKSFTKSSDTSHAPVSLRIVLHYPRFMFVADEGDPHSRALILRGLALVNANMAESTEDATYDDGKCSLTSVNGDFQNISSYILPDVAEVLFARDSYRMHIEDVLIETSPYMFLEDRDNDGNTDEPISLLLPVTMGVEFEQRSKDSVVYQRSIALNMDPVSLMISAEDLQLIRLLAKKWSSSTHSGRSHGQYTYDVVFDSQRLGIGLRKVGAVIVVDAIHDQPVGIGDALVAVNGQNLIVTEDSPLADVVERLKNSPRPLRLTFSRGKEGDEKEKSEFEETETKSDHVYRESMDISLAKASLTLIGNEVPILRGIVSTTQMNVVRKVGSSHDRQVAFSSVVSFDYYNLRIWGWEPFMEAGSIKLAADMHDPLEGSKTLTLETSDCVPTPISFNITDACASAISKLMKWDTSPENHSLDDTVFVEEARKAANAALRFAKQQKNSGSKPFLLQNQSGISCAFVVQKKSSPHVGGHTTSFVTVGDYSGLQNYDSSEISEIPAGGDCKFRLDRVAGTRQGDGHGRVPSLTVAFQSVFGVTLEPLVDLQIVRAGVTLLPLACECDGRSEKFQRTVWVSWTVEPRDEMTVLKLSSTFRISSLLHTHLEIGVGPDEAGSATRSLGTLPVNHDFFLPLWLCLKMSFELSIRPVGGNAFSPLFSVSEDCARPHTETAHTKYVECPQPGAGSTWLAASKDGDTTSTSITIDCVLTLLNMLPIPVEWEVSKSQLIETTIDGSSVRQATLKSGESAEILSANDMNIFVRIREGQEWSHWLSLEPSEPKTGGIIVVRLTDIFGVPLDIGARIARKDVGFRVTLFAELWFLNTTALNVSFGVSAESMHIEETTNSDEVKDDISTAEAALKEFSSLFEAGDNGRGIRNQEDQNGRTVNMMLLPSNRGTAIVEECFEYVKVENSSVVRRWWASSDPLSTLPDLTLIQEDGEGWSWIDPSWILDTSGGTCEGWETAPHIFSFSRKRDFHEAHPYRRRRWHRTRRSPKAFVNAFFHRPFPPDPEPETKEKKERKRKSLQLGIQVNGGDWSLMSQIPVAGVLYGVIRAPSSRWRSSSSRPDGTYELCYNVSPLDGEWGDFSRLMTISSRFIVRNDSKNLAFEVKQAGTDDSTAIEIPIGGTVPFHWVNHMRPELICVRPCVGKGDIPYYRWSGGFDPLTIGVIPLRIRKSHSENDEERKGSYEMRVRSLKVESKIRPDTGRTGINISLEEEDERADGCLFRIDNRSLFPIWVAQDGILANPLSPDSYDDAAAGDCLLPNQTISFALDVPYRQGKYKHRKAATLEELLRLRISLAPLHSRSGIESTKVVALSRIGSVVRLNPSKLSILEYSHRNAIQQTRVIGAVTNDGPTRVLHLVMMRKEESLFPNPFTDDGSLSGSVGQLTNNTDSKEQAIIAGAEASMEALFYDAAAFPTQEEALRSAMNAFATSTVKQGESSGLDYSTSSAKKEDNRGVVISFRMSFNGFIFSLVDSSPGEIAVITLKNLNALASWNTQRTLDSTVYVTVSHFQVDNMIPNSPYPVAISPEEFYRDEVEDSGESSAPGAPPLLVVGLSFGPRHKSGIAILKSVTIAPRNLAIRVDLAFLVRLQKYVLDLQKHFSNNTKKDELVISLPDLKMVEDGIIAAALAGVNSQRLYFGGLTILPCTIKLSVAPAKALSVQQAALEGEESAAIHRAVRKGDVRLGDSAALLGVKIGNRNATPLAVMRGVVKSIVVDALLRLDGASLAFAGVSLQNHIATGQQLGSILTAHYLASLRQNVPALVGSMSALGNPAGLVRGLGDGVSDFVLEPVKGFQRSVQEMDASYLVDGVARGTLSLARHTVGGFADSAAALAETFSKNMAVLTLDRRYAQKRDRGENLRELNDLNVALGLGSGFQKLARGFVEGVTGVVKAPMRGAEKRGFEGFAKGVGKGLLGLLVKPIIGISDGFTDVMIGVKGAMDGAVNIPVLTQIRPRRALYGRERAIRTYNMADAAASALMMRTRLAGELYMSHVDMGDRVALFSVKRILMLGPSGQELLVLKYKHIESLELRQITLADGEPGWGIIIILNTPRRNGSEVEVINCKEKHLASEVCSQLEIGMRMMSNDLEIQAESGDWTSTASATSS